MAYTMDIFEEKTYVRCAIGKHLMNVPEEHMKTFKLLEFLHDLEVLESVQVRDHIWSLD